MTTNVKKRSKPSPRSSQPYKRRSEAEMLTIVKEIHENGLPKKTACKKYGVNRNTLKLFTLKQSTKELLDNHSLDLLSSMNENQQHLALTKKIKELSSALAKSELKVTTLETLIKVAEDDLKIKIRKKSGTKQSKE
jgi:transposase-like protein